MIALLVTAALLLLYAYWRASRTGSDSSREDVKSTKTTRPGSKSRGGSEREGVVRTDISDEGHKEDTGDEDASEASSSEAKKDRLRQQDSGAGIVERGFHGAAREGVVSKLVNGDGSVNEGDVLNKDILNERVISNGAVSKGRFDDEDVINTGVTSTVADGNGIVSKGEVVEKGVIDKEVKGKGVHLEVLNGTDSEEHGFGQQKVPEEVPAEEVHHLFFLKVHKAASTTVLNVVYRFALSHHLVVFLPKPWMANILSEQDKKWSQNADPLPPGAEHFDILCNHLIFDEASIRRELPEGTAFVGIVRQPFEQFVSAFWYYREKYSYKYLLRIPGQRPISTYLQHPRHWEPKAGVLQFTNNRMSIDFGMDPNQVHNKVYVKKYVQYLSKTFHLVMVSDRFDESILLLRRLLGWKVQDVVYIQNNVRKNKFYNQTFTSKEKRTHRSLNLADYALYERFSKVLDDKVRAAGKSFSEEVKSFQVICRAVSDYCHDKTTAHPMVVQAEPWREEFSITKKMCDLMMMDEIQFVDTVRKMNGKKQN